MKFNLLLLFILISSYATLAAQEKKAIYIFLDKNGKDLQFENQERIRFFVQPMIDASHFVFMKNKNEKKVVLIKDYRDKLLTKKEANKVVYEILEEKAKNFEKRNKGYKGNIFRNPPYAYNTLFEKIYLFKELDSERGVLYEVDWVYAIE